VTFLESRLRDRRIHRIAVRAGFALACLMSISTPIHAQDSAKPAEKWRPKDGLYDAPGADLNDRCTDIESQKTC
jgi:hypothetical protein